MREHGAGADENDDSPTGLEAYRVLGTVHYKYSKKRGALQEQTAGPPDAAPQTALLRSAFAGSLAPERAEDELIAADIDADTGRYHARTRMMAPSAPPPAPRSPRPMAGPRRSSGRMGMFWTTVDDGERMLRISRSGKTDVIIGPKRVWAWGYRFKALHQHVAHPGEFLMVRSRDGTQNHLPGPAELWSDPRVHLSVSKQESLPIDANEAVVAYTKGENGALERRVLRGPTMFVPQPGEWLHTFSWHGSTQTHDGAYQKVPHGLVFQKLWLLPDQMYHDVEDVRTSDGAVLTLKLMIFFELRDIERMLDATHDPIGDFVNAATSDVVDFVGRHDFNSFKQRTDRLNELETYGQLLQRAKQTGYEISKIVYRGYRAPGNIQEMHDAAIESRTRLALERETEQQAQELADYKLDRRLLRAEKEREERRAELAAELENLRQRQEADRYHRAEMDATAREHLEALHGMGVDLTAYLTQGRADQVVEVRGGAGPNHVHLPIPE